MASPFTDTEKLRYILLRQEGIPYYIAIQKIKKDRQTNQETINTPTNKINKYN